MTQQTKVPGSYLYWRTTITTTKSGLGNCDLAVLVSQDHLCHLVSSMHSLVLACMCANVLYACNQDCQAHAAWVHARHLLCLTLFMQAMHLGADLVPLLVASVGEIDQQKPLPRRLAAKAVHLQPWVQEAWAQMAAA